MLLSKMENGIFSISSHLSRFEPVALRPSWLLVIDSCTVQFTLPGPVYIYATGTRVYMMCTNVCMYLHTYAYLFTLQDINDMYTCVSEGRLGSVDWHIHRNSCRASVSALVAFV